MPGDGLKIVALHGQARSGKDSTCKPLTEILSEKTGKKWIRRAFADPVKEIFCKGFNVDKDFIEKWKVVSEPPPGFKKPIRKALQFIGDGFREILEDCWINMAIRQEEIDVNYCISDGRYPNEAKSVANVGGLNVVIWRPGFENDDPNRSESEVLKIVKWCLATDQNGEIDHSRSSFEVATPEGVENYHYFLRNDGNEQQLCAKVQGDLFEFVVSRI